MTAIALSIYSSVLSLPGSSLTCWILPGVQFVISLFMLATIAEASHGINLNGDSSIIYESAFVLTISSTLLALMAADRIYRLSI
ncbi:unnamed protein product [Didymodactylos carnosus]|nr:unnamed protein product [Didymodactylos carnosus]CAF4001740.1 unnamed protein product [Didymodactylos carnosus]